MIWIERAPNTKRWVNTEGLSRVDKFQLWLMDMDAAIGQLVKSAPSNLQHELDGSDGSLVALEQWVLTSYENPMQASAMAHSTAVDGAARYFGEIVRVATSSKWFLDLENATFAFYGIPVLKGGNLKTALCPLTTITASTDRRTGTFLSTILENVRKPN